jgi:DNA invertase Pin-like site-specific DNA recombinase
VRKIGYARVSTDEQNLDLQRAALEGAGCACIYEDHGISGAAQCRPGLSKALADMSKGDVLVVWKLDRLGRSLPHLVGLLDELGKRGVGFASITESIDTTTAGGRLVFHMMAALAEFERSVIVERTKAGMSAARRRGKRLGRPGKLTAEHLAHARALLATGEHTRRSVAALLGVDESTLRRGLKGCTLGA